MGHVIFLELLRDCQPAHGLNVQPFWMRTKPQETNHLHGDKMHSDTKLITILRRSMHDSEAPFSVGSQECTHLRLPQLAFQPKHTCQESLLSCTKVLLARSGQKNCDESREKDAAVRLS